MSGSIRSAGIRVYCDIAARLILCFVKLYGQVFVEMRSKLRMVGKRGMTFHSCLRRTFDK